jgi:hypothetical protein
MCRFSDKMAKHVFLSFHYSSLFSIFLFVGDSPRGPLEQLGNPHLKPATKPRPNKASLNHARYGPHREGTSGPPSGPLEDSLE